MHSNIGALLFVLVATAIASAIPHSHAEIDTFPLLEIPLDDSKAENDTFPFLRSPLGDTYDCQGSGLCKSLQVRACDDAVNNKLIRNDDVNYGAPGSGRPLTGACSAIFAGCGCGVFIQGASGCARTGNQMWYDYQDIRASGCRICGSKHWGAGCLTTINYVCGC